MQKRIEWPLKNFQFFGWLVAFCLFLAACGGGGDSSGSFSPSTAPSTQPPTTPSTQSPPVLPPPGITSHIVRIDPSVCPEIAVYVSVTDQNNETVLGLTDQNFQLLEDGVEQLPLDVTYAENISESIVFSLTMDYTLSLNDPDLIKVEEAASYFVNELFRITSTNQLDNWGEIVKFVRQSETTQGFTNVESDLIAGIEAPFADRGITGTYLYDAIGNSIGSLTAFRNSTQDVIPKRSILIVITDGLDTASKVYDIPKIITEANAGEVEIITVGIGSDIDAQGLYDIANGTGGLYFFAPTTDDLLSIFTQFLDNLKNQYIIKYTTSDPGSPNMVEVFVNTVNGDGYDLKDFDACQ